MLICIHAQFSVLVMLRHRDIEDASWMNLNNDKSDFYNTEWNSTFLLWLYQNLTPIEIYILLQLNNIFKPVFSSKIQQWAHYLCLSIEKAFDKPSKFVASTHEFNFCVPYELHKQAKVMNTV